MPRSRSARRSSGGLAGCLSFFPSKNLGAFGDAGAVYTDDAKFADRLVLLRTHGGRPKYYHQAIGGNFRIDALQAAILQVKLPHLAAWTAARRANADRYRAIFGASKVPAEIVLPSDAPGHIYNQFTIRVPHRDALRDHLTKAKIGTEIYYPVHPFHVQPWLSRISATRRARSRISERAAAEVLALPIYPEISEAQQQYVVDQIAAFYAERRVNAPRIALLGCGYWGKNLVRNFHAMGALAAIVDPSPAGRATAAQLSPGTPVYETIDPVLADPSIAGVVIATPAETHADLVARRAIAARRQGRALREAARAALRRRAATCHDAQRSSTAAS